MTPPEIDCPVQGLTLSVRSRDGYAIATIGGDLDIACVPALREQLLGVLGPHSNRIVVVLSGVTFCDASGLAVLIGVSRRAWLLGGVLRLAAPAPPVTAVLRLTGLDLQFEIFATELAATSAPVRPRVPDASLHRHASGSSLSTPPADPGGSLRLSAAADDDDVREAVTALLAHADAWRDADPDRRLTRPLRALARAHASANRTDLTEAARSLLAGLLRHPLTHSPAVAATATGLRRLFAPDPHRTAVRGRVCSNSSPLQDRAARSHLDRGDTPAVEHHEPVAVLAAQRPAVLGQGRDDMLDDVIDRSVRSVVDDVQVVAADEADPEHDLCPCRHLRPPSSSYPGSGSAGGPTTRRTTGTCRAPARGWMDGRQTGCTFSACGPFGPCVTVYSTFWFSSRLR